MGVEDRGIFSQCYLPIVYRRARYLLGNHEDAEDATQETFLRALRSAKMFESRCQIDTWLIRITTNLCLNQLRDKNRQRQLLKDSLGSNKAEAVIDATQEHLPVLRRLFAEIDEDLCEVAVYILIDGMSHQETSELLGLNRRTVGNMLQRFIERSKAILDNDKSASRAKNDVRASEEGR